MGREERLALFELAWRYDDNASVVSVVAGGEVRCSVGRAFESVRKARMQSRIYTNTNEKYVN